MKKIAIFLIVFLISAQALAVCDSTDIKKNEDGSYTYGKECHVLVGKTFKELEIRKEQVKEMEKSILFRDSLTIKLEQQSQLWMDTSFKLNDKIQTYEKYRNDNQWLVFGAGVLTVVLSGWALGQVAK
jgi:uncharacterized protein YdeI (BOF family)